MADAHLLRSLDVTALEAEAAIRRDESEAADDLALSLRQGSDLHETLRRWGSFEVSLHPGTFQAGSELGLDYVAIRGDVPTWIPLGKVVAARMAWGPALSVRDHDLRSLLRSAARKGSTVNVERVGQVPLRFRGLLVQASLDHIVLRTGAGEIAVPFHVVDVVRLLGEGGGSVGEGG